jgi:hypothetical protein
VESHPAKDDLGVLLCLCRYPTPGIVNAKTGEVIDADAFGKVFDRPLLLLLGRPLRDL